MPGKKYRHAESARQQHLMGAALAVKRGESKAFPMARKVAGGMTEKQLKEFATKPKSRKK